jgi:LPPG:FO 2-phospho-L-lactate transferase
MVSVVALAGGVGAARLLRGLVKLVAPEDLLIIGNTGDDVEFYGLHISPDIDILMYTLAELVNEETGWGIQGDTFNCLEMLTNMGYETWFKLGDKDIATHLIRTKLLKEGYTLSETIAKICKMLHIKHKIVPMTNNSVRTKIITDQKKLDFQTYFVKRGTKDKVKNVIFEGSENAKPAPGIIEAIEAAERVVICPSNPILSISPILSIPTIREQLRRSKAYTVAVSPIIGGKAVKGPADKIMTTMGLNVSPYGVAEYYKDFLDHIIIDTTDKNQEKQITQLNLKVTTTNTLMKNLQDSINLSRTVLNISK